MHRHLEPFPAALARKCGRAEDGQVVIRWRAGDHYPVVRKTCTEVQVFHRQYRENEAKTVAKVKVLQAYLYSVTCSVSS